MAILLNAVNGSDGTVISTGNSATYGTAFDLVNGSPTYSTAQSAHGGAALLIASPGSTEPRVLWNSTAAAHLMRAYIRFTAAPPSGIPISLMRIHTSSGTAIQCLIQDDRKLAMWGGTGATSTAALAVDTWYRVEMLMTATSQRLAYYVGDSATATWDSGAIAGTFGTPSQLMFGKYGSSSYSSSLYMDDLGAKTGADAVWGSWPYTEPLPAPTVTLGATTKPSTIGGSNGSQVVTWGAVAGAASYEAWLATGNTPAQGDFTLVASGVTSPYTFTGLSAGTRAYGIKAKA